MFLIMKRAGLWRLSYLGIAREMVDPSNRDRLVRIACALARRCGSSVYVYNEVGGLEWMRTYPTR